MNNFGKEFPGMKRDYGDNRPGYLIAHADSLGYQSLLMEFPGGIRSMEAWEKSDIPQRMIRCLDAILQQGVPACKGNHIWAGACILPTEWHSGYKVRYCLLCGAETGISIPAAVLPLRVVEENTSSHPAAVTLR
jgi:hypothetical protein